MKKNAKHITSGDFESRTWIIIHETWLNRQLGNKGTLWWSDPYAIYGKHINSNYYLQKLDGSILKEVVPVTHLKLFYFHDDY